MELRQLATFQAVANARSFTRAAEELRYAQSSVTAQIQSLEEELGVPLFERLGRRISLTGAGQRLLEYAEKMLRLAEEARSVTTLGEEPSGSLSIGAPESLCTYRLPLVLQRFLRRYPRVQVHLRPGTCFDLRAAAAEGKLDLVFQLESLITHPALTFRHLLREQILLLSHPSHPLTRLSHITPREIDGETYIATEPGCSYRALFDSALQEAGARPALVMDFSSVEAIKQCTMSGLGITVLPQVAVAAELAQGRLVALPWTGPDLTLITQMGWHKDKWLSPALMAFLELSTELLRPGPEAAPGGTTLPIAVT